MKKIDVLLIYPHLGSFDELFRDIPLSLIYAATDSIKKGYTVKILDMRFHPEDWREVIDRYLQKGCALVGISVMTGNPIITALKISNYIKSRYDAPIVWGGPHPTALPEQTLENENIDYVIRDWGSKALCELIQYVKFKSVDKKTILGLGYKVNKNIKLNQNQCNFEMLDFRDLPYHLVDIVGDKYNRMQNGEVVFPVYTAVGCPYKCSFCMSPAVYKKIKGKKWLPYETDYVIEHIDYLLKRYQFQRLQFYDDDSFVDIDRMHDFFTKFIAKGFQKKLRIDFRGARINEIDKMDTGFLKLMEHANVSLLAIGVESGSDRILKIMNKGITVEQTLRVNRKLAAYPSLKPHYNFFCGIPGENLESLIETKKLLIRLLADNPNCYLGVGADWKPFPGSVLTETAVNKYGFKLPRNLSEWSAIDSYDAEKLLHPWYTKKMNDMIKLLQITGLSLDNKINDFRKDMGNIVGNSIYMLSAIYRPILLFRLKYNFTSFLFEYMMSKILLKSLGNLITKLKRNK